MCDRLSQTFVINLEKSKERWASVQSNLNSNFKMPYTRWNAVYGAGLSQDQIQKNVGWLCQKSLCTSGIIGCYLSHVSLWQNIWDSYYPKYANTSHNTWFLILEDDMQIAPNFCKQLDHIFDDLKKWNIKDSNSRFPHYIHLSCQMGCRLYRVSKHLYLAPFLINTTAYLVSLEGIRVLLDAIPKKVHYHVDFMLTLTNVLTGKLNYFVAPNDVIQSSQESKSSTVSASMQDSFPRIIPWILDKLHGLIGYTSDSHLHVAWQTHLLYIGNIQVNISILYLLICFAWLVYLKRTWLIVFIVFLEMAWTIVYLATKARKIKTS